MKNIILVLVLLATTTFGCGFFQSNNDGTWNVVSVNCPNILAEKNSRQKIFIYKVPRGIISRMADYLVGEEDYYRECARNHVQPGWIVFIEKGEYSVLPPPIRASK